MGVTDINILLGQSCNEKPNFAYWQTENGKLIERRGRKSTDLRDFILGQRGYRIEYQMQVNNNDMGPVPAVNLPC